MSDPTPTELVIRGKRIAQDRHGFLSLTDIWRLSGENLNKKPKQWARLPTTKELIEALVSKVEKSHLWTDTPDGAPIYSKPGNQGGTFAHPILALAFAEYLSPELGIEVRSIALRFWAGDVTLLDEFARRRQDQAEEDSRRVALRDRIREHNSNLQFRILHSLGARNASQYAAFHNSGYRGLYNGEDENAIHRRKELEPDQSILDHMGSLEASANWFRTSVAEERLRNLPVKTVQEACATHLRVGQRVRDFMKEEGR